MFETKNARINRQAETIKEQTVKLKQKEAIIKEYENIFREIADFVKDRDKNKTPSVVVVDKIKEVIAVHCK